MISKSFPAVRTKVLDSEQGVVRCLFSATGNVDRQNDIIEPGAFSKALGAKTSVPVVYAHKWDDINQVLGRTTSWREMMPGDPGLPESLRSKGYGGVEATIQFEMGVPSGRAAFVHVKNGNLTDYSFAFDIDPDGAKAEGDARHIKSIKEIYEVTVALIGANQFTATTAAKVGAQAELAVRKAHLVRKVTDLARKVERTEPSSAKKTAVLAAAKVLLADEEESDRKDWNRVFRYVRQARD